MTRIEWAHHAHNVVDGCSPASPGCDNCYAARLAGARMKHRPARVAIHDSGSTRIGSRAELVTIGKRADDKTKRRYVYNGRVALNTDKLRAALKIPRAGGKAGPRTFWNHQSDTFNERLSFAEIAAQFAVMAARPDLQFMVLTKRPERARGFFAWLHTWAAHRDSIGYGPYLADAYRELVHSPVTSGRRGHPTTSDMLRHAETWPLSNVALGVSAEDQQRWDERVPLLLGLPAAMRFVSVEPMIGPVVPAAEQLAAIDQLIIGAESGPGARPMDLRWAQYLARAVLDARGPALFFKQGDVCRDCDAEPLEPDEEGVNCARCRGLGRGGKVRKDCPRLHVPGHGTQSWAQFPDGW